MKRPISFTLNGDPGTVAIEESVTLLEALRGLGLTSPRYGCGAGECGTCAVLIVGEDKPSCSVVAATMEGRDIVTLEGIGTPDAPHPIQVGRTSLCGRRTAPRPGDQ